MAEHEDDAQDRTIELEGGRLLGYLDLGDPEGVPIVSCHGGLSSRLDVLPAAASATAHGVRLLAPDRPGIGQSDRREGRTLLDWPADVAALADQLGLDRFGVMGWSVGGLYAQAVGRSLGDRVRGVALIASPIPPDWDGMRDELNRMDRVFLKLSGHAPGIDRTIFHLMHATATHLPKAFAREMKLEGDVATQLPAAIAEGLTDVAGVVDDYRVFGAPWGFEPSEITVPVHVWQGDADDLVPPAWGPRLADAIPGARLTVVPDAGHFLWYDHWDDIFDWLLTTPA